MRKELAELSVIHIPCSCFMSKFAAVHGIF